jgi:putative Mg2+ transporter-C (MgtC) family protein
MDSNWETIFRLVLAAVLGACVGLERELHGRPAGLRTYLILSLGSCLIMVVSEYLAVDFHGKFPGLPMQVDPGRIAAQAVTGIGFLGAGVILRYKDTVRGLTTAACIWTVCAVGLAVGGGFYLIGTVVTALTLLSLLGLKALEKRMRKDWYQEMEIVSDDVPGLLGHIQEILARHQFKIMNSGLRRDLSQKEMIASFSLVRRTNHPDREVLQEIFELKGVKRVGLDY